MPKDPTGETGPIVFKFGDDSAKKIIAFLQEQEGGIFQLEVTQTSIGVICVLKNVEMLERIRELDLTEYDTF